MHVPLSAGSRIVLWHWCYREGPKHLQRSGCARQVSLYGIRQKPGDAGQAIHEAAGCCNLYGALQRLSQAAI